MGSGSVFDENPSKHHFWRYSVSYDLVRHQIRKLYRLNNPAAAHLDDHHDHHRHVPLPSLAAPTGAAVGIAGGPVEASIMKEAQFRDILQDEMYKVNQFALLKEQEVTLELQRIAKRIADVEAMVEGCDLRRCGGGGGNKDGKDARVCRTHDTAETKHEEGLELVEGVNSKLNGVSMPTEQARGEEIALGQKRKTQEKLEGEREYGRISSELFDSIEVEIEDQSAEVVRIDEFIRYNFRAFVDLQKEYDKTFGVTTVQWFIASLVKEPFANVDFNRLMILLSLTWERFRHAEALLTTVLGTTDTAAARGGEEEDKAWKPPESFIRETTKYWVRPGNVVKAKCAILRHMPYLIFGCTSKDLGVLLDPYVVARDPERSASVRPEESQLVSSVYFDSLDAYSYSRRLMRFEGAELVRFRWYGDNAGTANKEIYIERKTHHEGWSGQSSAKERCSLPQRKVFNFMKGHMDIDAFLQRAAGLSESKARTIRTLGKEIQNAIIRHRYQPMVRTSYLRAAFQLATSNEVRFSIDTNLCMVDELISGGHHNPPWCRVGEEVLAKDEVVRFPYAVLEVKLQTPAQPPWVSNMLLDCDAVSVYKFSKFQHGMAFLHRDLTEHFGLPHWIDEFEKQGYVPGFSCPKSHEGVPTAFSPMTTRHYQIHRSRHPMTPTSERHAFSSTGAYNLPGSIAAYVRRSLHAVEYSRAKKRAVAPLESTELKTCSSNYANPLRSHSVSSTLHAKPRRGSVLQDFYPRNRQFRYNDTNDGDDATPHDPQTAAKIDGHGPTGRREERPERDFMTELALLHARGRNIRRIDPKSNFAAERTFLHYVQKGLYLCALAAALTIFGRQSFASRVGCMMVALAANAVIIYALVIYLARLRSIDKRITGQHTEHRERIDSQDGPVVLFGIVFGLLVATFILNLFGVNASFKHIRAFLFGEVGCGAADMWFAVDDAAARRPQFLSDEAELFIRDLLARQRFFSFGAPPTSVNPS